MQLADATALVTGANRGLGLHITQQLLDRGARKVYVTGRNAEALQALSDNDQRLAPLTLDVTDLESVAAAAEVADDVDLLVNNAGVLSFGATLATSAEDFRRDFDTNVVGVLQVTQAFAPTLIAREGAVANVVTLVGLSPMVGMAPYCASKAATHSLTQSLRADLRPHGVAVHGFYPAGIDTDMLAGVEGPKEDPADVARALMDGIEAGSEDIHPTFAADPIAVYNRNPKELERMLAGAA